MSETELSLTAEEQTWLTAYRKALNPHFPGLIDELIIFQRPIMGAPGDQAEIKHIAWVAGRERQSTGLRH